MNPAPLKDAVEVIRPATTSDETLCRMVELLTGIGKTPARSSSTSSIMDTSAARPVAVSTTIAKS